MTIKVIAQSDAERRQETMELFVKIKPFLDEGCSYNKALKCAGIMSENHSWRARRWTRDIVEYAKEKGY